MDLSDENEYAIAKSEVVIRKYGLLEPKDWGTDCDDEMRRMDAFWNTLVNIHEDHVARYLCRIAEDDEFAAAKNEYDGLVASHAQSVAVAAAKKQLAIAQKGATRRMAVELRALEAVRYDEVKVARKNSGLWWGNYNAIARSFERARSAALRGGHTMRRRSGDGDGRITNTLQGGADLESLYDGSLSQIMVRPPSARAWSAESRGERRRLQRTVLTVTIFVRDGERRTVTWPMIMHRPIPPECRVKEAIVTRRRQGSNWRWAVSFVCARPAKPLTPLPASSNRIGVDIGWRRVPEGLRVATVLASGGVPRYIVMPSDMMDSFSLIDDLRRRVRVSGQRGLDLLQDADAGSYKEPYQNILRIFQHIPEKKIAHVKEFIRSAFFLEQDLEVIDAEMLAWRREFMRLLDWSSNQQKKVVARRNHFYQNSAIEIVRDASDVVINDIKFGEIAARRPEVTDGVFFPNRANWYRTIAAPSELIGALKLQAAKRGIAVVKRDAESPVRCPSCGSTSRKTRADALPQVCANCETRFDQDVVACESLLAPAQPTRRVVRTTDVGLT